MPQVAAYSLQHFFFHFTGDVQINDTDLHNKFKKLYRREEQHLMLEMLKKEPKKIPEPDRQALIDMAMKSMNTLESVDFGRAFKRLFLTNSLDGSEDWMISDKLKSLVYDHMVKFRAKLMKSEPPKNIEDLFKTFTPPKGVKRKTNQVEGAELFDHDDDNDEMELSELDKGGLISDGNCSFVPLSLINYFSLLKK